MTAARARARALLRSVVVAGGVAAVLAGCSSTSTSSTAVTATGPTLSIWLSAPRGTSSDPVQEDTLLAEKLAFEQLHSEVKSYGLRLQVAQDAEPSADARQAIQDTSSIAYLGELAPGASEQSLGITNAVDLLQLSPTDTALELTTPTGAVSGAPRSFLEDRSSYGNTFARVVPDSAVEAMAQAREMKAMHLSSVYVTDDGSDYGKAIAAAVRQDASGEGISAASSESGAGGVFVGAASPAAGARLVNAAASASPSAKIFGSSSLDSPVFTGALSPSVRSLYLSTPGFLTSSLPPAGRHFVSTFTSDYGHAPSGQAIFGYAAMAGLLSVLKDAGSKANERNVVVKDVRSLNSSSSVLGDYSISAGNTNLQAFVFSRYAHGSLIAIKSVDG